LGEYSGLVVTARRPIPSSRTRSAPPLGSPSCGGQTAGGLTFADDNGLLRISANFKPQEK